MIYLDNAATTKQPRKLSRLCFLISANTTEIHPVFMQLQEKAKAITKGREQIANVLGAKPEEIYFTAGGSESDNWALKATFEA